VSRERIRGSFLILFSIYYSIILFAVLPETQHVGQLLLPLAVTGGMGLWGLARGVGFFFLHFHFRDVLVVIPKQVQIASWCFVAIAVCWSLACIIAYPYSVRHRDHYVNDITELAARGVDAPEAIKDPRVFSVSVDPKKAGPPTGYILTIQASENPGPLTCRHLYFSPANILKGRVFVTHHKLYPARSQYFAVSCIHSQDYGGDNRPYVCTVIAPSGCSIVRCRQLDLSTWKRLPFSTVFCDGEHLPGSPDVGTYRDGEPPSDRNFERYKFNNLCSEISYSYSWHLLTVLGLPWDQNFAYPGLRPLPLVATPVDRERFILRIPRTSEEPCHSGLPLENLGEVEGVYADQQPDELDLRIHPGQTGPIATYDPLVVQETGIYILKVKYRQTGLIDWFLKAIPSGDLPAPRQQCLSVMEDNLSVKCLELRLKAGEHFQLQLVNQYSPGTDGAEIVIQEIHAYREKFPLWGW